MKATQSLLTHNLHYWQVSHHFHWWHVYFTHILFQKCSVHQQGLRTGKDTTLLYWEQVFCFFTRFCKSLVSLLIPFSATGKVDVVCWLLNVPATCQCISGTDLLIFTCCHTEIEVADPTFHLTRSQYTDNGPTSPRTDPITPGAWQGSHWSANF